MPTHKQIRTQRGFTLIGMSVTLAIAAALVGTAVPTLSGAQQHQRLRADADQLRADIQELRQLAVTGGRDLQLHVESACYIVHDGARGDCHCDGTRHAAVCEGSVQVRKVQWPSVSLSSNATKDMTFSAQHATVTPTATLRLNGSGGEELHQIIAITGRVRSCVVGRASNGLPACP